MKTYTIELEPTEVQLIKELLFNINPTWFENWLDDNYNPIDEDYLNRLEDKFRI